MAVTLNQHPKLYGNNLVKTHHQKYDLHPQKPVSFDFLSMWMTATVALLPQIYLSWSNH